MSRESLFTHGKLNILHRIKHTNMLNPKETQIKFICISCCPMQPWPNIPSGFSDHSLSPPCPRPAKIHHLSCRAVFLSVTLAGRLLAVIMKKEGPNKFKFLKMSLLKSPSSNQNNANLSIYWLI